MTTDKKLIVNQKIKSTAIILAVFFGPYSFIYTWKKDSNHALIQIIFYTLGLLFGFGFSIVLYLPLLFWIVTLITVLLRGNNFYFFFF